MHPIDITMNEKQLAITLTGAIDTQSVQLLINEIELGFDYYKFSELALRLNSPGGEYTAMRNLMDVMTARKANNHVIHVHANQVCASAAALVLATGHWGTRSVELDTELLFHWSRATVPVGQTLTSGGAANLAHGLSAANQRVLDRLVSAMCRGAGSSQKLVESIAWRLDSLLAYWDDVEMALRSDAVPRSARQYEWVKELQRQLKRWVSEADAHKQKSGVMAYLKSRFERDSIMDLREAYAVCLIDVVNGVLPVESRSIRCHD